MCLTMQDEVSTLRSLILMGGFSLQLFNYIAPVRSKSCAPVGIKALEGRKFLSRLGSDESVMTLRLPLLS